MDVDWNIDYDGEDFTIPYSGSVNLLGCKWIPNGEPKFTYVFVHGLGVFATFKKDFFKVVLDMGGVVYACDHYGHGRSPGKRVDLEISDIVKETVAVIQKAKSEYPAIPLVLHGHSMGGCAVVSLCRRESEFVSKNVSCVMAEAPWLTECPSHRLNCLERFALHLCCIKSVRVSAGVSQFSEDNDPAWVEMMENSPWICYTTTPKLTKSQIDEREYIRSHLDNWPSVPFLMLQGRADDLVDASENEEFICELMSANPDCPIEKEFFEGGPHVMLKTPLRPKVIKRMVEFIERNALHSK